MDIKFGGLSWGTMYKKIEKFCNENDLVQIPRKYADTVGKHVKILIDEVVSDWVDPPGDSADGSDNETWLMPLTTDVVSEKSTEGLEGKKLDGVLSDSINANSKASHVEKMGVATCPHLDCQGNSDSIGESSCITLVDGYDYENSSSSSSETSSGLLDDTLLPSEPLTAEALTYEGYHDKPTEPGSVLDGSDSHSKIFSGVEDINRAQGSIDIAECCEYVCSEKDICQKSEDYTPDGVELPVGFGKGDYFNSGTNDVLNMELTEQFQEIDLQGSWDEDEDYELAMISLHESRQRPFKKNLSAAFISKLRSLKKKNRGGKTRSVIDVRKLDKRGSCSLDNAKIDMDSDWELL